VTTLGRSQDVPRGHDGSHSNSSAASVPAKRAGARTLATRVYGSQRQALLPVVGRLRRPPPRRRSWQGDRCSIVDQLSLSWYLRRYLRRRLSLCTDNFQRTAVGGRITSSATSRRLRPREATSSVRGRQVPTIPGRGYRFVCRPCRCCADRGRVLRRGMRKAKAASVAAGTSACRCRVRGQRFPSGLMRSSWR
jgi:hypothetical protein